MSKGRVGLLAVLCLFGFAACAQSSLDVTVENDVVYGNVGGMDLKMDLAKPGVSKEPTGAVVCMHGGAWQLGNKAAYGAIIRRLAEGGYVAAAVGYRLAPADKWPAQIEDVKCAVRYLRAHAKELNIDPNRIGSIGDSAGGHLALMAGLLDSKDGMEGTGGNPEQPSKVQAVVNLYGPTELSTWKLTPEAEAQVQRDLSKTADQMMAEFLGTADRTAKVMAEASPITYVNAGDPPVLTFHGDKDEIVPLEQGKKLHAALEKAGVPQKLVVMEGAGHGWDLLTSLPQALDFFNVNMKVAAAPEKPEAAKGN